RLDKGHTAADAYEAVGVARKEGIDLHPTWLPFTPWTRAETVVAIARFIWSQGLAPVTDPVQLSIRLLIPDGSLVLDDPIARSTVTGYDPEALGYTWESPDPTMDLLQAELAVSAETGSSEEQHPLETLTEMTHIISEATG